MLHKYPVLIISKDRATTCTTHKLLDQEGINWYYCVEPQDYDNYVEVVGKENVINIQENDQGIAYTRNYCIKWSLDQGYEKHWQFDDDITKFMYRGWNKIKGFRDRVTITDPLKMMLHIEEICDRFKNFGAASLSHDAFAFTMKRDIDINKMVYCCYLINNKTDCNFENHTSVDVDFSCQLLSKKFITLKFNIYTFLTPPSGTSPGGCNSSHDYLNSGRKKRNEKLVQDWYPWFVEYEKKGQSEIKPSQIWNSFTHKPILK